MAILLKVIYRFNVIPIKIPMTYFIEIENNSKMYMEAQIATAILSTMSKAGDVIIPDFKLYSKLY
jgi:hypothetical protein